METPSSYHAAEVSKRAARSAADRREQPGRDVRVVRAPDEDGGETLPTTASSETCSSKPPLEGVEVIEDAVVLLGGGEAPPLGALVRFEFNELVEPHSNRGWSRAGLNVAGGGRKRERWKTRTGR